jgi:bile acid:Na+ symporter, BASS family
MTGAAFLPIGLAFLMLVVGLRLTLGDFLNLWRQPKAVALGLVAQMLLLPLMALAISWALRLPPQMQLGLLVVAAAPGGITSNFITLIARGDAALSATMTLGTSLAACLSIPLVLILGQAPLAAGMDALAFGVVRTGLPVLVVSAVPLVIGMVLRRLFPAGIARWANVVEKAATLVFFAIVAKTFWDFGPEMLKIAGQAAPSAILLNLGAIGAAFLVGKIGALPVRQTLAIAIECGLQNIVMAMFVADTLLQDKSLLAPALVYAVVMNVSALVLVAVGRSRSAAVPQAI